MNKITPSRFVLLCFKGCLMGGGCLPGHPSVGVKGNPQFPHLAVWPVWRLSSVILSHTFLNGLWFETLPPPMICTEAHIQLFEKVLPFIWLKHSLSMSRLTADFCSGSGGCTTPLRSPSRSRCHGTRGPSRSQSTGGAAWARPPGAAVTTHRFRASILCSSSCVSRALIHSSNRSQDSSFRGMPLRKSWRRKEGHGLACLCPPGADVFISTWFPLRDSVPSLPRATSPPSCI